MLKAVIFKKIRAGGVETLSELLLQAAWIRRFLG